MGKLRATDLVEVEDLAVSPAVVEDSPVVHCIHRVETKRWDRGGMGYMDVQSAQMK